MFLDRTAGRGLMKRHILAHTMKVFLIHRFTELGNEFQLSGGWLYLLNGDKNLRRNILLQRSVERHFRHGSGNKRNESGNRNAVLYCATIYTVQYISG